MQFKKNGEEMVVEKVLQSTTPTSLTAIISTYSCILFLSKPGNIDHSFILFLVLYLLNPTLLYPWEKTV